MAKKSWQDKALEAGLLTTVEDEQARYFRENITQQGAIDGIVALHAQLAAANRRIAELEAWQPVDVAVVECACEEAGCDGHMEIEHGLIQVETHGSLASIKLPDGWALFRRNGRMER